MLTSSGGDASELVLTGPLLLPSIPAGPRPLPSSHPTRLRLDVISWMRTVMAGCAVLP
jgi:hypothetical protein